MKKEYAFRLVPARTIYFAFGHDEEVGGGLGASSIAKLLGSQGIEFEHILDEGGSVLIDGLKGLTKTPVGLVGIAEKVHHGNKGLVSALSSTMQQHANQRDSQEARVLLSACKGCMAWTSESELLIQIFCFRHPEYGFVLAGLQFANTWV